MPTRRTQRRRNRKTRKFAIDPACWGKNKPLEQFWRELSSHLSVVVIYKGSKPYEFIRLHPHPAAAEEVYAQLKPLDDDPQVTAILSAHPDIKHAYEMFVYPNAKDKTVDYVITHHAKIFKRAPPHMQKMFNAPLKKMKVPH